MKIKSEVDLNNTDLGTSTACGVHVSRCYSSINGSLSHQMFNFIVIVDACDFQTFGYKN